MNRKISVISTTDARKQLSSLVSEAQLGSSFVVGRREAPQAILIPYPRQYCPAVSEMTNFALYAGAFEFLEDEPDLYSPKDIKKKYV